jgi:drug/metabolite transporter (DMT)-like permease
MVYIDILYLLITDFFIAGCNVVVKPFKEKLILLFWSSTFSYLAYVGYALYKETILQHAPHPWKQIFFDYTLINIPFYTLIGIATFASLFLFAYLLKHYDLSLVSPILKVSMLIQTVGYLALGQTFYLYPFLGVLIVLCGAIISVWPSPNPKNFAAFKKQFPFALLVLAIVAACFKAITKIIIFLLTQKTPVTIEIQQFLDHTFHHMHPLSLTFVNPFHYNVGVRFFIVLCFLIYIIGIERQGHKIVQVFRKNFWFVLGASALNFGYIFSYFTAYSLISDKIIISPLTKLALPITLVASYYLLGEKITTQKVVGYSVIVAGGLIALL